MNRFGLFATMILMISAYTVGAQHGDDQSRFDARAETITIVADFPFANACSEMLEAAWAVEDVTPAGLPHNP